MNNVQPEPEGFYLSNTKVISLLVGIVSVAIMAFCTMIYNNEQRTAAELRSHIVDTANKASLYVRKDDLADIKTQLNRIEGRLDQKADKTR